MTYVYSIDRLPALPPAELASLIGGKAAGLAMMTAELRLPVPPAFAITTETCREFLSAGWPAGLDRELSAAMGRLEEATGRRFAGESNPLLVSVRSGAPVSMPGMMDTILDLGLNEQTARGLARASGDAAFAADCHQRFVEMFKRIVGSGSVPDDPWQQLRAAIEAVFRSWNTERAAAYRSRQGIPPDLGTAVTVQAMVFGNWGPDSASGVVFTRDPATGEPSLYGDVLFASQGEDVVAGTQKTQPIGVLETRMPEVYAELGRYSSSLERHLGDLCDIEFTIEQGRLWLLQVRVGQRSPRAALRVAVDMAEALDFPLTRAQAVERTAKYLSQPPTVPIARPNHAPALTTGRPASPGVATGQIATSSAAAVAAAEAGRRVILVRPETSPDDVRGMARSAGVLTSAGGLASHAAVVARGWGIPAVVGAEAVTVGDDQIDVRGRVLKAGDTITIDGGTGEVFAGEVVGSTAVAPEVGVLMGWARELGIPVGEVGRPVGATPAENEPTASGIVRALMIKGSATPASLADGLLSSVASLQVLLEQLVAGGLVERAPDGVRLTRDGRAAAEKQLASDRLRWGPDRASDALNSFQALDRRVKETVTAWQLREVDGAQVLNDHADPDYDAGVLHQLTELHAGATAWLSSVSQSPPELRRYLTRLERAVELAREGDQRFVASPRVDSYHSVWFELHEELILLAGRSRAEESAAGRA